MTTSASPVASTVAPPGSGRDPLPARVEVRLSLSAYDDACRWSLYDGVSLSHLMRIALQNYLAARGTPPLR